MADSDIFCFTSSGEMAYGLSMAGGVRTKEKCPKCEGRFEGNPLRCPVCLIPPKKYFIDLHEKGYGRLKIYSDKTGHPLDSHARAQRVLEAIRYEIDQHIFDPSKYSKTDLKNFLFETRIEAWYESKVKETEKGNLATSYTKTLKRFKNTYYLGFFRGMDVRDIRAFHIQEFYEQLPNGKSLKYISNILKALQNFFNTLHRYDIIHKRPSFPVISVDRKDPLWIDSATQVEMLETIPRADRPIFTFLAFQGVRPSEARALKVKDLNFKEESLRISRTFSDGKIRERVKSKVIKPRAVNPALLPLLKDACENKHPEAYVFLNPRTGKYYDKNALTRLWAGAKKTIREKSGKVIEVSLYEATRHSFASIAVCNGAPLTAIKEVLGHTDIRTTLKYAHSDLESQRVVFQRLKKGSEIISLRNKV